MYDLNRKARLYAAFAVREVWVINARTLATHVHRSPGIEGYQDKREVGAHEVLLPSFAPSLAVTLGALDLI